MPALPDAEAGGGEAALREPCISVIVPARDEEKILPRCLQALREQSLPREQFEVIVVDDGSRDGTSEVARANGAGVLRQENLGPAAARNAGAREARGSLLAFTDADCAAAPDFLERMVAAFEDNSVVGAMGAYGSQQEGWVARFVQLEFDFKQQRLQRRQTVDTVHTYAAAYRRKVFLESGGFDTAYPTPSNEDQELSYRLAGAGHRMVFRPDAVVFHLHDATLAEYARRKFWLGYWKAYTLSKHPRHIAGDSHTPRSQLIQIALVLPLVVTTLLVPVVPGAAWPAVGLALGFAASCLSFLVFCLRRSAGLLWTLPGMLALRAAAQAAGLVLGFLRLFPWWLRGSPALARGR